MSKFDYTSAVSRRTVLAGLASTSLALPVAAATPPPRLRLAQWLTSGRLPAVRYQGPTRFNIADVPDDPYFLLGNHRLTLFVHASGHYRIITGDRGWARLNAGKARAAGDNGAALTVDGTAFDLIGLDSPAAGAADKVFGVGSARFSYAPMADVRVLRTVSVAPSLTLGSGPAAFQVRVTLRNLSPRRKTVVYDEWVGTRYLPIFPPWDNSLERVKLTAVDETSAAARVAMTRNYLQDLEALPDAPATGMSLFDVRPPALAMAVADGPAPVAGGGRLSMRRELTLKPHATETFVLVIGAVDAGTPDAFATSVAPLLNMTENEFAEAWQRLVPDFSAEDDAQLRAEMQWNVHALEAMATYKQYYDETIIPEGTDYDYDWGWVASSRDLCQHALPMCHIRPELARSVLRYVMKRTLPDGEIKLVDQGYGWVPQASYINSDAQLFFFLILAEYLKTTADYSILTDDISWYPAESAGKASGGDHVRAAFQYLRERVGTGPHGLIRLWNSDWNDMFYFWPTSTPYNILFDQAESHLNTAMALTIFSDLAPATRKFDAGLADWIDAYRMQLMTAFRADLGDRRFPARAYFADKGLIGKDEMWLEPQGYAMMIDDMPMSWRLGIWQDVQNRLMQGEALGARQIERTSKQGDLLPGQRENGGFWYALNGPVILGLVEIDKPAAAAAVKKMSFANYANQFPDRWIGQWSAPDSFESSLAPKPGWSGFGIYCAHAHAWPLHGYLKLNGYGSATEPEHKARV